MSKERRKKGQKKPIAKKPPDPFWHQRMGLVRTLLRKTGRKQRELRDELRTLNEQRELDLHVTPRYNISHDYFMHVIQGNSPRPHHYLDFLSDISEILALYHPATEQAEKLKYYRSALLRTEESDSIPDGLHGELHAQDIQFLFRNRRDGFWLLNRLRALNHQMIEDLEENVWEAPIEDLIPVYMNNPDTWRIVIDDSKRIVGYWHFVPLTLDKYGEARNGTLLDRDLISEAVQPFEIPGPYDIYIAWMGVLPKYGVLGPNCLLSSFLNVLDGLSKSGHYVRGVCANGLTTRGKKLCEVLMPPGRPHEIRGCVFEGTMKNILQRLQIRHRALFEPYEELLPRYISLSRIEV